MTNKKNHRRAISITVIILIAFSGCQVVSSPEPAPSPTPTPIDIMEMDNTEVKSACEGLGGYLDLRVLIGPSDAVGLEPVAVGEIPFSVVTPGEPYDIQGGGGINYEDILEEEWGTYTVKFHMDADVTGACLVSEDGEILDLLVTTTGDQLVEVRSEGFQGDYPWAGTKEFNLSFPLEEGATQEGEGWAFILHLEK